MKVQFCYCTKDQYDSLQEKDPGTLYFLTDTQEIYLGTIRFACGA